MLHTHTNTTMFVNITYYLLHPVNYPVQYILCHNYVPGDEKQKVPSSKNGSRIPTSNEMPTLDAEPDKDTKDVKKEENEESKPMDVENGKIVDDDNKTSKTTEIDSEQGQEKSGADPNVPVWVETPDGQIEVDDSDDYLIYLEDILKRIHK